MFTPPRFRRCKGCPTSEPRPPPVLGMGTGDLHPAYELVEASKPRAIPADERVRSRFMRHRKKLGAEIRCP